MDNEYELNKMLTEQKERLQAIDKKRREMKRRNIATWSWKSRKTNKKHFSQAGAFGLGKR